jgi:hypothetical protein
LEPLTEKDRRGGFERIGLLTSDLPIEAKSGSEFNSEERIIKLL